MKKKTITFLMALLFACSSTAIAEIHFKTLDKVNSPSDIKVMDIKELNNLAKDIRAGILNKTNLLGGHVGPDLGIVEVTIAMHYVFNSPTDKFIFDTSHQCYPHKMITGRKEAFTDPLNHSNITGFSNYNESPHDFFIMGHTSTSISLAEGMAKARDLKGEKYNVIALIGDGSLSGGEALEGLNNSVELNSNFIIIVNDNEMCIAENHGGLYKNLQLLRDSNGTAENNMFKALGYDYYYVSDGHDLPSLIDTFKKVKDTNRPTIVHIHTIKGKGYIPAMQNKEKYHWMLPGYMNKKAEKPATTEDNTPVETYTSITVDYVLKSAKADKRIIAVSPATPMACGLFPAQRQELGNQYADMGIAEQHAVGFSSGVAKNGGKPILMVCSSFLQRAYDQLSQDLAINKSPAVILVVAYGINGGDVTHNGVFDIPLISNIPNIVYLAPTNKEEYLATLDWAVKQDKYPVAIRVPVGDVVSTGKKDTTDYSIINKFKIEEEGKDIAIIAEGNFFKLGQEVKEALKGKMNIDATLINPVYLSGIDYELLESLKQNHTLVITLEDGVLDGGFGEKISRFYSNSNMKVLNYGAQKEFTDRVPQAELYKKYRLTPDLILEDVVETKEMTDKTTTEETPVNNLNEEGVNNKVKPAVKEESKGVNDKVKPAVKEEPKNVNDKVKPVVKEEPKKVNDKAKPAVKEEPKNVNDKAKPVVKEEPKEVNDKAKPAVKEEPKEVNDKAKTVVKEEPKEVNDKAKTVVREEPKEVNDKAKPAVKEEPAQEVKPQKTKKSFFDRFKKSNTDDNAPKTEIKNKGVEDAKPVFDHNPFEDLEIQE